MELTILMPCLNEEATLGTCVGKAMKFLSDNKITGEVLIADNGSTDRSISIAQAAGARVEHVTEKGYGNALLRGIKAAKGTYVIMGDSDDSYDFLNLMPFVEKLREGYELVMGNRFRGGIQKGAMPFLHRYLGNPVLSFIGRLFFKTPIRDFHCGLRGFHREKMLEAGLNTPGMEFASEMVVKAVMNKLKITEVPTTLSKDGRNRKPHLNTWRDGWRHLRFLLIFSPQWLFFYPGMLFLLAGLVITGTLLVAPVHISGIRLDIHTLLYSASSMFIGFQLIVFYCFAKVYGGSNGLLPKDTIYRACLKFFNLEKGIMAGSVLIITGIALTLKAYFFWSGLHFGNLEPRDTLRIVIPAVMSLITGVQVIQNSFFISILGLKTK